MDSRRKRGGSGCRAARRVGKIAADEDAETVQADDEIGGEGGVGSGVFRNKGSKRFGRSHGNRHGQVGVVHVARMEPEGRTVVIVALAGLRQDMQRRCDVLGIWCARWEDSRSRPDAASIV
jgi:hypothetical protein